MLAVTLVPLFLSLVSASQTHPSRRTTGPSCTTFKVPITASAQNSKILAGPSTTDPTSLLGQLTNAFIAGGETALGNYLGGPTEVKGTYSINMMYCQPEVYNAKRAKTLQFLVHPATMTIEYWDQQTLPGYSWVDYFSKEGYPMLAIDRLGAGQSDHPNPYTEVQANLQTSIHHEIIQKLRTGSISQVGTTKFENIVFIGGSYGSILGNQHAVQYPKDVDAYILTGYTNDDQFLIPIFSARTMAVPAAIADPTRYKELDYGYLTNLNAEGREFLYSGKWKKEIFDYDEAVRGTVTVGEALTANAGTRVAPDYTGYVHLIVGAEDKVFCGTGINNAYDVNGDCTPNGHNIPAESASYFPAAKHFDYTIIPETGHITVYHSSVKQTFSSAKSFLVASGF